MGTTSDRNTPGLHTVCGTVTTMGQAIAETCKIGPFGPQAASRWAT